MSAVDNKKKIRPTAESSENGHKHRSEDTMQIFPRILSVG
jgi:hypothetical protein